jgi:hypothetical protein
MRHDKAAKLKYKSAGEAGPVGQLDGAQIPKGEDTGQRDVGQYATGESNAIWEEN